MNGARALRCISFSMMRATRSELDSSSARRAAACSALLISAFSPVDLRQLDGEGIARVD
jgi:hypothetical protein